MNQPKLVTNLGLWAILCPSLNYLSLHLWNPSELIIESPALKWLQHFPFNLIFSSLYYLCPTMDCMKLERRWKRYCMDQCSNCDISILQFIVMLNNSFELMRSQVSLVYGHQMANVMGLTDLKPAGTLVQVFKVSPPHFLINPRPSFSTPRQSSSNSCSSPKSLCTEVHYGSPFTVHHFKCSWA